jgi:DNA-binding NtrC family response regulator
MSGDGSTVLGTRRLDAPLPDDVRVRVASGPDRGRAVSLAPNGVVVVGQAEDCGLTLRDPRISRRHLEFRREQTAVVVRDLDSTNGSSFGGAVFQQIRVGIGAQIQLGDTLVEVEAGGATTAPVGIARFGDLIGKSAAMHALVTTLQQVAASDASVLVQGETGTGKELVAEGLHRLSPRASRPFIVCDLAGISRTLVESELFGHVRGAFSGADRDREGAFTLAHGGTIFLDEVGEMDAEMQPRLLRALERRQVKPVGGNLYKDANARVVAATNRDLRAEIAAGRFRADLYHRLAVVEVTIPPLRERREDIPVMVEHFLARIAAERGSRIPAIAPDALAALSGHDWPGNVRQLRNVIERAIAVAGDVTHLSPRLFGLEGTPRSPDGAEPATFREAKDRLIDSWEHDYLTDLLQKADGNVSEAARRSGLARGYLHLLLKKHGLDRQG